LTKEEQKELDRELEDLEMEMDGISDDVEQVDKDIEERDGETESFKDGEEGASPQHREPEMESHEDLQEPTLPERAPSNEIVFDAASLDFLSSLGPKPPPPKLSQSSPFVDSLSPLGPAPGPAPPLPPKPAGLSPVLRSPIMPAPRDDPWAAVPTQDQDPWATAPPTDPWAPAPPTAPAHDASAPLFEPPPDAEDEVAELLKDMGIAQPGSEEKTREQLGGLYDRLAFLRNDGGGR
jgi:hypothetical protein